MSGTPSTLFSPPFQYNVVSGIITVCTMDTWGYARSRAEMKAYGALVQFLPVETAHLAEEAFLLYISDA